MSLNKVMLIGNVGKDPEIRHLENNLIYAGFTLATTERYKDRSGEAKEITEWHNIVCWRSLAELADKYIRKGSQIFIEGRIRTRSWDDQNGQKRYTTEILADKIQLLGKREGAPAPLQNTATPQPAVNGSAANSSAIQNGVEDGSDDLPF